MKRRNLLQSAAASAFGFALTASVDAQAETTKLNSPSTYIGSGSGSEPMPAPTLSVGGVLIGKGAPKIVVPITGATPSEAMNIAQKISNDHDADLAEFRIDYLKGDLDPAVLALLCADLRQTLNGKPLLATYRTSNEGGKRAISARQYEDINQAILQKNASDLIDIEMMTAPARFKRLLSLAQTQKIAVIVSNHNFKDTPPTPVLLERLKAQQRMGADILKLAVMPKNAGDTLRLMEVTWLMQSKFAQRPMITMAMGREGVISRVSGALTGSAMSYGSLGSGSAPGELRANDLKTVLGIINATEGA